MSKAPQPDELLPLRPVEFQVLVSLSRGERHGWAIIKDAEERGEGSAVPGLATLYRALKRMAASGLIEECRRRGDETVGGGGEPYGDTGVAGEAGTRAGSRRAGDGEERRRRYFRMTAFGRRVAEAEARRLSRLVRVAEETALLERK